MSQGRIAATALAAGFATAVLMGCGIDTKTAGREGTGTTGARSTSTTSSTSTTDTAAAKKLPKRPKGVVAVEGPSRGTLTPQAIRDVQGVAVNFAPADEDQGFDDFCRGRIDVLDASRLPTAAELRLCKRMGVELTDRTIQVASDALVVATRNESDVGGDCLRLSTVNDIFRAGSPLTNWSQVGFFNIPIHVTGREAATPEFQFFAQAVLGVPANGSLADVRSDYILRGTDDGVRNEVTSQARVQRVIARYGPRLQDLFLERSIAFKAHVDRAVRRARDRMLRRFAAENKSLVDKQITLTESQKALIERRNLRRIKAAILAAQLRAQGNFSFPQLTFLRQTIRNRLRRARVPGTIGFFRFSYYELYENLLRPMEIWDPAVAAGFLAASGVKVTATGPTIVPAAPTTTTSTTASTSNTSTVPATTTTTGAATTTTTPASTTPVTTLTTTTTTNASDSATVNVNTTPWCVFPSVTTITNGSYPLSRRFLLYVSKLNVKRDEVKTFLRSYLAQAQRLAARNHLLPIPENLLADDLDTVNGTTTVTTTTGGGTGTTTTQTTATVAPSQTVPGVGSGGTSTTSTTSTTP
jgi:hypothetical protein